MGRHLRLSIYRDLDRYFKPCTNCGECCRIPGVLLPDQVDPLAEHLGLSRRDLFDRFLVAELYAPDDATTPVFMLSPVKARPDGTRLPQRIFDDGYVRTGYHHCIFRDAALPGCGINAVKPLECAMLLCQKMTGANPFFLDKKYFHQRWLGAQDIVFDMVPEARAAWAHLDAAAEASRQGRREQERLMRYEMSAAFAPPRRAEERSSAPPK